MKRDKIACSCRNITYGKIEDAVKNGAITYNEIEERLGCGKSCGSCKEFIQCYVRELTSQL